ncbi:hypothetical protein EON80_25960, partial [bacterium]
MINDTGQTFEELLAQARTAFDAEDKNGDVDDDYDPLADDDYFDIVWLLGKRGNQVTLDQLLALTGGDNFERKFAVDVLGRFAFPSAIDHERHDQEEMVLAYPERFASKQIIDQLLGILKVETDEEVLSSLVSSLGQQQENDERIPLALQRFVDHPNDYLRWHLATGMGSYETP